MKKYGLPELCRISNRFFASDMSQQYNHIIEELFGFLHLPLRPRFLYEKPVKAASEEMTLLSPSASCGLFAHLAKTSVVQKFRKTSNITM